MSGTNEFFERARPKVSTGREKPRFIPLIATSYRKWNYQNSKKLVTHQIPGAKK